jgi:ApaG protein
MSIESSAVSTSLLTRDPGSDCTTRGIRVLVRPTFLPDRSDPAMGRFTWTYKVAIANLGDRRVQLRRRHWVIVDGDGNRHEVEGEGVVGHQPDLAPGHRFEYASFCPLEYPWGTMEGEYTFEDEHGEEFRVQVGRFFLVSPHV